MAFKRIRTWYAPDDYEIDEIPVCDECEREIHGDVAVIQKPGYTEENELCPHCAELLDVREEDIRWAWY